MKKWRKILFSAVSSAVLFSSMVNYTAFAENTEKEGFCKVNGEKIVDSDGNDYLIKGMAFGNNVWANPKTPPENLHHTEDSYRELAEMGFNSVRFYLNYGLFEDDSNPYEYSQTGFDWIDENLEWAKKYGIKLILNMHYPQGGYQSQGNGYALWTDEENQKRLAALWKKIAEYYKDEPYILGYGIVNEPIIAVTESEDPYKKWHDIAQNITDEIRTVDTNHIIFAERLIGTQSAGNTTINWNIDATKACESILLDDDNTTYEFHLYEPHEFSHQGMGWAGTSGKYNTYPDESKVMLSGENWYTATFDGEKVFPDDTDWTYKESNLIKVTKDNQVLAYTFQCENAGTLGSVFADDITIEEYDENGEYVGTAFSESFDTMKSCNFWSSNNSGDGKYTQYEGHNNDGCLKITRTTSDANIRVTFVVPTVGHSYKATGYFKSEDITDETNARPRVDIWTADSISKFDKNYLESKMKTYVEFKEKYNVPLYCGEYGACYVAFEENRGGERWVGDMIDILSENNVGFNYHTYHEESFGLYRNNALKPPAKRNNALYNTFYSILNEVNGDVDLNTKVNISDVVYLQKWILCEEKNLAYWKNADVNKDGKVNVLDICLLKEKALAE